MNYIIKDSIPDFLNPKSGDYNSTKVFTDGHFYLYDKTVAFLEARLDLYKKGTEEKLTYILWCAVGAKEFISFSNNPNDYGGVINAKLYSEVTFYENTKELDVILDFKSRDVDFNPSIIINDNSGNEKLLNDFFNGIDPGGFDFLKGE